MCFFVRFFVPYPLSRFQAFPASFDLGVGVVIALTGLVIPSLRWLYDYAWFVGCGVAGLLFAALMPGRGGAIAESESQGPGGAVGATASAE